MSDHTFSRREWLALPSALLGGASTARRINTVTGPVSAAELGRTLIHEHILIDFIGAADLKPDRYDRDEAFAITRPFLEQARKAGLQTLVEGTPEHLGRDAVLLRRLSEATGVHIVACTGIYGARRELYIPKYAWMETAEQLAARYQKEFEHGIGSTGIRPGVIKLAVNPRPGTLDEVEQKLVRAAALAHLRTGMVVEGHTDKGRTALEQLEIFAAAKAPSRSFIWIHAHEEQDHAFHLKVGGAGAWVSFDGIRSGHLYLGSYNSLDWHVECVRTMKSTGLLGRVLLSQDAGWYHVGEPKGGTFHGGGG
jgi:predicted metal-dependent phosphotriesterase family hydrolase